MKIAYILMKFPADTFIINEITELVKLGHEVKIFSFRKNNQKMLNRDIQKYNLLDKTYYLQEYPKHSWWEYLKILFGYLIKKGRRKPIFSIRLANEANFKDFGLEYGMINFFRTQEVIEQTKNKDFDIIHAHFATRQAGCAMKVSKFTNIPFTFTAHAFDIYSPFTFMAKQLGNRSPFNNFEEQVMASKRCITISKYNKDFILRHFDVPSEKVEVIHCGIDLEKFNPKRKKEKSDRVNLLTVARLDPVKGLKYAILACHILKEKNFNFKYLIAGEGQDRQNLETTIKDLGLEEYIKLEGEKTQEELIEDYYPSADIFILTSISEAMSVANAEALACGVPVIATRVRGIPEMIEDNVTGLLVEPKNPEQLANAIIRLKDDEGLRSRIIENGRRKIEQEFNIKKQVEKLLAVWNRN